MATLNPIRETSYLSAGNAEQYRRIMRIFYREYEKMHFQLYKEDVLELLRGYEGFEEYSMEQLKTDLNMLAEWKNLIPMQDPRRVYSIEDYKNKQYRYSMSEYAVEIERMTVRLEHLFVESGNLSSGYFGRIEASLSQWKQLRTASLRETNEWWRSLQEDFKRLNQNYKDYLREFYSGRAEKILKSVEFILHKDRFTSYLREFVRELQVNALRIEAILKPISAEEQRELLEKVIQSELDIPHPMMETQESMEEYFRENITGQWRAFRRWFLSEEGKPSECSRVLEVTDEIIRKIIQNAALIVQLQNWGISRREDYRKFLSLFLDCEDVQEAHKLAAHLFGIQHVRHYKVNTERSTESINSSTYEEEPAEFPLKPRVRTYRARIEKSGFEDRALEKLARRNEYLRQAEEERRMVMRYRKGNRLEIAGIGETVSESTRRTLLRWIAAANLTLSGTGRTEYGQAYRLTQNGERCILKCEDGELEMPSYVFEFLEE